MTIIITIMLILRIKIGNHIKNVKIEYKVFKKEQFMSA